MMKVRVFNIVWDSDDEKLPKETLIEIHGDCINDEISDRLSEKNGFVDVEDFQYEEI